MGGGGLSVMEPVEQSTTGRQRGGGVCVCGGGDRGVE